MKFIKEKNGFRLYFRDKEILHHSQDNPCIYAGCGDAHYQMHLGNFNIEEKLQERMALYDFEMKFEADTVIVMFSRKGINKVNVAFSVESGRLVLRFQEAEKEINRLWLKIPSQKEEAVYGCGEQYSYFNLKGKKFPLWTAEQGVGRNKKTYITFQADCMEGAGGDYYTTYFPQPTFISNSKYFCHVENSAYMVFDFCEDTYHEIEIWDIPEKIIFSVRNTYADLLVDLTALLGRQPQLPDWVYEGVWVGMQGGTDVVLKKLENALTKGLKVSAIWAQDWEGKRITYFGKRLMWNWEWDSTLYPGLDKEIVQLKDRGIRFMGYINPYLAIEGSLYEEASNKGYLVKKQDGSDYVTDMGAFFAGHVDLTNPEAFGWYKGIIKKNMIDFGLAGWMADFGEYLPTDAKLHNNVSAEKMHNQWPVLWAKANREAVEEAGKLGEVVFFMRSGYSGSQKYTTLMWAGDQNVDWSPDDGLPSVITASLSLGMSGIGLMHSDIGGYTTLFEMKRSKELFMRWAEMATFAPVMRTHEGNRPDDNWQFDSDDETLLHFAKMSRIYCHLSPYIKKCVEENSQKGIPVIRPLFLHYEDDSKAYENNYQFLLGRDLLVAPIYEQGAVQRKVYLPEDQWINVWNCREYNGGEAEIEAPLGQPPVFYRKKSVYAELFKDVKEL